jgi:uncharacterized protein (DUF488 family)
VRVFTIGHGQRPIEELLEVLRTAGVETLVDVRRFPGSRRNPQFNQASLAASLEGVGIEYRHALELGGRRSKEPGSERFPCIRVEAFRSYAARMGSPEWQAALAEVLAAPSPCVMCAETPWTKCHRRFIAELLVARGHEIVHLIRPHESGLHRLLDDSEVRDGRLYLCGALVA